MMADFILGFDEPRNKSEIMELDKSIQEQEVIMRLPSVFPVDGVPLSDVLYELREQRGKLDNARTGSTLQVLTAYQSWANEAARSLSFRLGQSQVEGLVQTRRHWHLQSVFGNVGDIHNMVQAEIVDRVREFDLLIANFEKVDQVWSAVDSVLVAIDTNAYIHQKVTFDQLDWSRLVPDRRVIIIIPELVLRELDRQKTYGKNVPVVAESKERVPARARHTIKKIRGLLVHGVDRAEIRPGLEVEFVANPLDHARLADPDSEFIERVLAIERLTGHRVRVATADVGMQFMARVNGLEQLDLPN
jgi:hypothetical protein